MMHSLLRVVFLLLTISTYYVSGGSYNKHSTKNLSECPLVTSLLDSTEGAIKETSMCMFAVLSLSTYIYKPDQPMKFLLISTRRGQIAKFYNIEVIDQNSTAVGEFVGGDNFCQSGRMLTHDPKSADESNMKIPFVWKAPHTNLGTLFFRFSVEVENADGTVSFWIKCDRQTPLKYFDEIQKDVLHSIEHPLSHHMNHRRVDVPLTVAPPSPPKVVQESPTPSLTKQRPTATRSSAGTQRPIFRESTVTYIPSNTHGYLYTDNISWCQPLGAARYQIVAGTGCTKYAMYPNSRTFDCFPGLIFSVSNCVCTYNRKDAPCTFP